MAYRVSYRSGGGFRLGPVGYLIITCIVLFIGTLISPRIIDFLGFRPIAFLDRPWTIVTSMFVHAGFWHLFTNMITLYFFGSYVISLIGDRRFWLVYFIGGIVGNIFYAFILTSPFSIAVGASGAIFALAGVLVVMVPKQRVFIIPIPVPIPLWIAVIGGFLLLTSPGIAWQAHLGGLLFGAVMGYFYRRSGRRFY